MGEKGLQTQQTTKNCKYQKVPRAYENLNPALIRLSSCKTDLVIFIQSSKKCTWSYRKLIYLERRCPTHSPLATCGEWPIKCGECLQFQLFKNYYVLNKNNRHLQHDRISTKKCDMSHGVAYATRRMSYIYCIPLYK